MPKQLQASPLELAGLIISVFAGLVSCHREKEPHWVMITSLKTGKKNQVFETTYLYSGIVSQGRSFAGILLKPLNYVYTYIYIYPFFSHVFLDAKKEEEPG